MATFQELSAFFTKSEKSTKDKPISTPVQVKVLTEVKIIFQDTTEKSKYVATTLLSDNTCVMECTIYSETLAKQYFTKQNCLMISNYIISERDGKATLIVNNKSVVFIIPNFAIKEEILQQAVRQQEELPLTSIAEASLLPKKRRISIEGKVTKVI